MKYLLYSILLLIVVPLSLYFCTDKGSDSGSVAEPPVKKDDSASVVAPPIKKSEDIQALIEKKIQLLEEATSILYNARDPEGLKRYDEIVAEDRKLEEVVKTLNQKQQEEYNNHPELIKAQADFEEAKRKIRTGVDL